MQKQHRGRPGVSKPASSICTLRPLTLLTARGADAGGNRAIAIGRKAREVGADDGGARRSLRQRRSTGGERGRCPEEGATRKASQLCLFRHVGSPEIERPPGVGRSSLASSGEVKGHALARV